MPMVTPYFSRRPGLLTEPPVLPHLQRCLHPHTKRRPHLLHQYTHGWHDFRRFKNIIHSDHPKHGTVAHKRSLSPTSAIRSDALTCAASGVTDVDGDTVSLSYTWTVNSGSSAITSSTMPSNTLTKGDVVRCTVTPTDGTDVGTPVASSTVTVDNARPTVSSATLSPTTATTEDDLSCIAGSTNDIDGDTVTLSYAWQVNSVAKSTTSVTLPHTEFKKGDSVTCDITPNDGSTDGAVVRVVPSSSLTRLPPSRVRALVQQPLQRLIPLFAVPGPPLTWTVIL